MDDQIEPITERTAPEVLAQLKTLMPTPEMLGLSTDSTAHELSFWSPTEMAEGRIHKIRRMVKRGWKILETGLLSRKASGPGTLEVKPNFDVPGPLTGDIDFDERRHAFALRIGATWIGRNRFRLGGLVVDRMGMFRDERECSECGSIAGEHRFEVPMPPRPNQKRWEIGGWTYCKRCCTPGDIDLLKYQIEHPNNGPAPRERWHR